MDLVAGGAAGRPAHGRLSREALVGVRSLRDAFALFGVEDGDRIDTRELVIMTSAIEEMMRVAKDELESQRQYEAAARLRNKLATIRAEFLSLQLESQLALQRTEHARFDKAGAHIRAANKAAHRSGAGEVRRVSARRREALRHAHDVQAANLDAYIANMHQPRVRYSKGLLDMMHSEKHMSRLDQFEDAQVLGRIIASERPQEVARHHASVQRKCDVLRDTLRARQDFERTKLEEKLHDLALRHDHGHEKEAHRTGQRLRHNRKDMTNRHLTAGAKPVQFCAVRNGKVRPVEKLRKGHLATDASFKGTHMLNSVRGDAIRDVVPLCAMHDFAGDDFPEYELPE